MRLLAVKLSEAKLTELSPFLPLLPREKRTRCAKFQQKLDKCRAIAGYLLLSFSLEAETNLEIRLGEFGKPYLKDFPLQKFNLAHAGEWVFLGLSSEAIGVDIAMVEKANLALAARFFASAEYQHLMDLPEEGQARGFAELWALKESYLKAVGVGLSTRLNSFTVSLGNPPLLLAGAKDGLKLALLEVAPAYVAAVCYAEHLSTFSVENVELAELISYGQRMLKLRDN